jgi:NADH dehydrogenase
VLQAEVTGVDAARREITLDGREALAYDHLIVAAGSINSYFGHDDWARHAPGLKTLADALEIRGRVIGAFEAAERRTDPAERMPWMTFVVIGGGPTGVEMAGTMAEIARHTLAREFRRIDTSAAKVVLIEGSDRVLGTFVPAQSARARQQLEHLGVEVRTGCRVSAIDGAGIAYDTQQGDAAESHRLPARTVIWAAGVAASPLGRLVAEATGAGVDRGGRVIVEPDLSLKGHPEISVIGDMAAAKSHGKGEPRPVPGVSPGAKQMGRAAAANIGRRLHGEPTQAFRYKDYGNLATVGRMAAVVDLTVPVIGALRFSGLFAWLFWLFAHIYFLIGFRNRIVVFIDWALAYWTYERHARVVAEPASEKIPP